LRWGADGLRLLPEIGPIEDVYLLRAIHEGLKRVSTPEELRRIYQQTKKVGQGAASRWRTQRLRDGRRGRPGRNPSTQLRASSWPRRTAW